MEALSVFIKTPKGRDEVRTRSHRLSARERTTLIMVDGTRRLADLQALSPTPHEVELHLQVLLQAGLIEPGMEAAPMTGAADTTPASAVRSATGMTSTDPDLEKTRQFIQEVAEETLGTEAAAFTDTLVGLNDAQSLLNVAQHLRDILYRITNGKEADQFLQTVRELAPKA